jgi:mannosyltransferase
VSAPSAPRGPAPASPVPSATPRTGSPRTAASPPRPGEPAAGERAGHRSGWALVAWWLPAAVPATVMAVLGVWGLARGNAMGNDEVVTQYAARLSLGQLFHLLSHVDAVHGLYYLIMHCWVAVGSAPAVMRVPSVIVMAAAAGLMVVVARRLTGSAVAGLFSGMIMALTPVISFYAQTARAYAMVFGCVLAATLALVRALDAEGTGRAGQRRWLLYGALVALGGYLNELSLLALAAHAVTVLLTRYGRRTLRHWLLAAGAGAFCVLPVVLVSIREDGAVGWATRPGMHDIGILFHDYFGGTDLVSLSMLALAVFAVLPAAEQPAAGQTAAGLPAIRTWGPRPGGPRAGPPSAWWNRGGYSLPSVAVPLLVLPAALLIGESWVGKPLYADRYVLYGEAGAALLAGAGVYRLGQWLARLVAAGSPAGATGWRSLVWLPGVIACVCALVLQLGPQHRARTPQTREFDYGDPAFYIGARARSGDGVLFFNTFYRKIRFGYPEDFGKITDFAMEVSPQRSGTYNGVNKPLGEVRSLMLTYRRIWVVGRAPSAHVSSPAIRGEGELLTSRYTRIADRHFRGIVVTLWLRR